MRQRRAVLFANPRDWHTDRLRQSFIKHGIDVAICALAQCRIVSDGYGLHIPTNSDAPPLGAFVRGIGAGTLEEITFRLAILHALEKLGVVVVNGAPTIERTVDKGMCSFLLHHAGLPTPPSWVCHDPHHARLIVREQLAQGHTLVCKPLFGSRGHDIRLLREEDDLATPQDTQGVWYLQRFIDSTNRQGQYRDYRAFIIAGRCVGIMERRHHHWIVNVHQGGQCQSVPTDHPCGALALRAARLVGAHYAGVDLIADKAGQLYVLEVNGIPAWQGLEGSTNIHIAECLAQYCKKQWTAA